jgi:hypothetical protein
VLIDHLLQLAIDGALGLAIRLGRRARTVGRVRACPRWLSDRGTSALPLDDAVDDDRRTHGLMADEPHWAA